MVSGCLSQVQVHVQETHTERERQGPDQTDRRCWLRHSYCSPSSTWCSGLTSYPRRPGQLIAVTNTHMQNYRPAWADAHGAWRTKIALHFCSLNLDNKDDSPWWLWCIYLIFYKKGKSMLHIKPLSYSKTIWKKVATSSPKKKNSNMYVNKRHPHDGFGHILCLARNYSRLTHIINLRLHLTYIGERHSGNT